MEAWIEEFWTGRPTPAEFRVVISVIVVLLFVCCCLLLLLLLLFVVVVVSFCFVLLFAVI